MCPSPGGLQQGQDCPHPPFSETILPFSKSGMDYCELLKMASMLSVLGSFPWEGSRTVGVKTPLDNTHLLLGLGLPNPALQALCKLITASETGEQLISRVS